MKSRPEYHWVVTRIVKETYSVSCDEAATREEAMDKAADPGHVEILREGAVKRRIERRG